MRVKWTFTDSNLRWIEDKFLNDPEVHARLNDHSSPSPNLDAAVYLTPLFKSEFPDPYPGESDGEFKKRKKNLSGAARQHIKRIPPESDEQFAARMDRLPHVRYLLAVFFVRSHIARTWPTRSLSFGANRNKNAQPQLPLRHYPPARP